MNGTLADGCEVAAICPASQGASLCPVDHHTSGNAAGAGSYSCDDSSSAQNMTGTVPSDNETHVHASPTASTPGPAPRPTYFSIDPRQGD